MWLSGLSEICRGVLECIIAPQIRIVGANDNYLSHLYVYFLRLAKFLSLSGDSSKEDEHLVGVGLRTKSHTTMG